MVQSYETSPVDARAVGLLNDVKQGNWIYIFYHCYG